MYTNCNIKYDSLNVLGFLDVGFILQKQDASLKVVTDVVTFVSNTASCRQLDLEP
jgi:hypothetical protein